MSDKVLFFDGGDGGFPLPTDLEHLEGWARRMQALMEGDCKPNRYVGWILHPDPQTWDALARLGIEYPLPIRQVQDFHAFADKALDQFRASPGDDEWGVVLLRMEELLGRVKAVVKVIGDSQRTADSKTDNPKKLQPENKDVAYLCRMLGRELPKGRRQIDIALEFTKDDKPRAKSLLRQCGRFRHLWQQPKSGQ